MLKAYVIITDVTFHIHYFVPQNVQEGPVLPKFPHSSREAWGETILTLNDT